MALPGPRSRSALPTGPGRCSCVSVGATSKRDGDSHLAVAPQLSGELLGSVVELAELLEDEQPGHDGHQRWDRPEQAHLGDRSQPAQPCDRRLSNQDSPWSSRWKSIRSS